MENSVFSLSFTVRPNPGRLRIVAVSRPSSTENHTPLLSSCSISDPISVQHSAIPFSLPEKALRSFSKAAALSLSVRYCSEVPFSPRSSCSNSMARRACLAMSETAFPSYFRTYSSSFSLERKSSLSHLMRVNSRKAASGYLPPRVLSSMSAYSSTAPGFQRFPRTSDQRAYSQSLGICPVRTSLYISDDRRSSAS